MTPTSAPLASLVHTGGRAAPSRALSLRTRNPLSQSGVTQEGWSCGWVGRRTATKRGQLPVLLQMDDSTGNYGAQVETRRCAFRRSVERRLHKKKKIKKKDKAKKEKVGSGDPWGSLRGFPGFCYRKKKEKRLISPSRGTEQTLRITFHRFVLVVVLFSYSDRRASHILQYSADLIIWGGGVGGMILEGICGLNVDLFDPA